MKFEILGVMRGWGAAYLSCYCLVVFIVAIVLSLVSQWIIFIIHPLCTRHSESPAEKGHGRRQCQEHSKRVIPAMLHPQRLCCR